MRWAGIIFSTFVSLAAIAAYVASPSGGSLYI